MAPRASRRSKAPVKSPAVDKPIRVMNIRNVPAETFRQLSGGKGEQGIRGWAPYLGKLEMLKRAVVDEARKEPVTVTVAKARAYLAAAGLLFPGG